MNDPRSLNYLKYEKEIIEIAKTIFPNYSWSFASRGGGDLFYYSDNEHDGGKYIHWFELIWWQVLPKLQDKAISTIGPIQMKLNPGKNKEHPIDLVYPIFKQLYK
jgi:hypothetical protein